MELFIKITGGILITAILCLALSKLGKDYALLLSIAVCGMAIMTASAYLEPIVGFFSQLAEIGQLGNDILKLLTKVVGIGLISQIAGLICIDAGNQSLGKVVQIITVAVILWISLPLLEQMLTLIESILGAI